MTMFLNIFLVLPVAYVLVRIIYLGGNGGGVDFTFLTARFFEVAICWWAYLGMVYLLEKVRRFLLLPFP